jgi:hypothetical protein
MEFTRDRFGRLTSVPETATCSSWIAYFFWVCSFTHFASYGAKGIPRLGIQYSSVNCAMDVAAMSATAHSDVPQAAVYRPHARHAAVRPVQGQAAATQAPALYQARHPEQSLFYRTIAGHFETWLALASSGQFDGQGDLHTPAPHVETAFRKYLEGGIFAYGFARARCDACGHGCSRYRSAYATFCRTIPRHSIPHCGYFCG